MTSAPVALILGVGPRVGAAIVKKFVESGYKVATVSRRGSDSQTSEGVLSLKGDVSNPESIPALFDRVKNEFKIAPSTVIYNAAALTPPPSETSVLSVPVDTFSLDLNTNTVSPYAAAQQAVRGWETLPKEVKKTFIYTGNALNTIVLPVPAMLTLGVGKSASAHWIGLADALHSKQGYRFFYADQRLANGSNVGGALDGPAHADFYAKLANHEGEVPWLATFVKDKGYTHF